MRHTINAVKKIQLILFKRMKKAFVLIVLFIFPVVAYLFFASGVHNFGRLPVLTKNVKDVSVIDKNVTLNNKITILGFLGSDVDFKK